jgi:hypothetical protein
MILTEQECKLFFDLMWSLQYYVNQKLYSGLHCPDNFLPSLR